MHGTPFVQVHYTFNLRDFAKIIFGVLLMKKQAAWLPKGWPVATKYNLWWVHDEMHVFK